MKIIAYTICIIGLAVAIFMVAALISCNTTTPPPRPRIALSWEKDHTERIAWSDALVASLALKIPDMSKSKDIKTFCPKYELLEPIQKTRAFAEIMIGMAKFESNWNPKEQYRECLKARCQYSSCFKHPTYGYCMKGNPNYDGGVITSRGLLQMSISSSLSYGCDLKTSSDLDDPIKNLQCAVIILDKQIKRTGMMTAQSNYWSVLKSTYSRNHIKEISSHVQKYADGCAL